MFFLDIYPDSESMLFQKSMLLFSVIEPLKFSGVIGFMEYCRSRADLELF